MIGFDYEADRQRFLGKLNAGEFAVPTVSNTEEDYYKDGAEDSKEKRDTRASGEFPECSLLDKIRAMK
jgi:hypothetical protein